MRYLEVVKFIETESRRVIARGWDRGSRKLMDTEFQFRKMDGSDGCKTMQMYLMSLNCALKIG